MTGYGLYLPHELDEFLREVGDANKAAAAEAKRGKKLSKARSRKRKG